jgi:hypothetical protein
MGPERRRIRIAHRGGGKEEVGGDKIVANVNLRRTWDMLRAVREPDNWSSGLVAVRREGKEGQGGPGTGKMGAKGSSESQPYANWGVRGYVQASYWAVHAAW